MRHRKYSRSFGRDHNSKKALFRGLVHSLVLHGRIRTTLIKAKELRKFIEPAITLAKKGDFNARRLLMSRFPNEDVVKHLCDSIATRFKDRPGGYTRIIRLGSRPGDGSPMAFIEFSDYDYTKAYQFVSPSLKKKDHFSSPQTRKAHFRSKKSKARVLRKIKNASRCAARA